MVSSFLQLYCSKGVVGAASGLLLASSVKALQWCQSITEQTTTDQHLFFFLTLSKAIRRQSAPPLNRYPCNDIPEMAQLVYQLLWLSICHQNERFQKLRNGTQRQETPLTFAPTILITINFNCNIETRLRRGAKTTILFGDLLIRPRPIDEKREQVERGIQKESETILLLLLGLDPRDLRDQLGVVRQIHLQCHDTTFTGETVVDI